MLGWKPGEAGGCAALPRAHGAATVGTEARSPPPICRQDCRSSAVRGLSGPLQEEFAGPWLMLGSLSFRVGDGGRGEAQPALPDGEPGTVGSGAVCNWPPGFHSQHPPRGPFLSQGRVGNGGGGPWRVLQTGAGSLGSKERPWHLLTQTEAPALSPPLWSFPFFFFLALAAVSLRAVGYHMPLFIHSGGDSWAHPAGGIWSPPPPSPE